LAGFEPAIFRSTGKHTNRYTTRHKGTSNWVLYKTYISPPKKKFDPGITEIPTPLCRVSLGKFAVTKIASKLFAFLKPYDILPKAAV
jgi:hypothetical protein